MLATLCLLTSLAADFLNPPSSVRPWCYWYWVNGNVTRETIVRDLSAMKRVGFGGLLLVDPRGYDTCVRKPEPKMAFAGPEWVKTVGFAARECARLGLEFTINLSDCGGSLKGPWLTHEDGPKRLVCGVNDTTLPRDYQHYHDIATLVVHVASNAQVKAGWRDAGGVTGRWQRDEQTEEIAIVPPETPHAQKVTLRFGYCLIPKREHDVDVIDAGAVERHWQRVTAPLLAEIGDLVGTTWTHVYSVSWEGAIPTWTPSFEEQFRHEAGYALRPHLPALAGFVAAEGGTRSVASASHVLRDYRRVRNTMFKNIFYGTVRRLAHARGLKLYSESGGPWNRDPSVFREADQLAFLGVNDMPQGEFWTVRPDHHTDFGHNRSAANAAHVYGLRRASAEAFTHMHAHYSMWPERLKPSANDAFADGINHFVWHTFTCSPESFGKPGIEYFAGTHLNPNVTWFDEAGAFVTYLARCQALLQAGENVADIAVYAGHTPYRHWGRYRDVPCEGARIAIPSGYNYDLLNDETLDRKDRYAAFVDATKDTVVWPKLPLPDFEGPFQDVVHRRMADGMEIYFVMTHDRKRGTMTFRARGDTVELWDPITGTRQRASDVRCLKDGRTSLKLSLPPEGCVFVVMGGPRSVAAANGQSLPWATPPQRTISLTAGPWQIDIGGKRFDRLGNWTASPDDDIRYFAGKASYKTTFTLKGKPSADRTLYLGRIAGGLARVKVNGVDCGVAWCAPWRVCVAREAMREGANELEVIVVNTWKNRLIGDCFLAEGDRKTKSCLKYKAEPANSVGGYTSFRSIAEGYNRNDALEPCGLYGPVELK